MKTNPNRYYHALCRKCPWSLINASQEQAEKVGMDHYYQTIEEGHKIKFFDSTTRLRASHILQDK